MLFGRIIFFASGDDSTKRTDTKTERTKKGKDEKITGEQLIDTTRPKRNANGTKRVEEATAKIVRFFAPRF